MSPLMICLLELRPHLRTLLILVAFGAQMRHTAFDSHRLLLPVACAHSG